MDASTKKMIKTFGIIVGALVVIFIILMIVAGGSHGKVSDNQLTNTLESAAKKYYADHKEELPETSESAKVTSETLIAGGYMKSFDKLTKNTNCSGEVLVIKNEDYEYLPTLTCSEYKSTSIAAKLKDTVVTSGDGLYKDGETYYFKGEYVNNYIKIGDTVYRIISIDSDNNIKVISDTLSRDVYFWDDRYNIEKDDVGLGVNDYSKSRVKEGIEKVYEDVSKSTKKYVIEYNWCADKLTDSSLNSLDCTNYVSDYVGLIKAGEYAKASLDENCTTIYSSSCKNYNYLANIFEKNVWTMDALSSDTYSVIMVNSQILTVKKTNASARIAAVFNISGYNITTSGLGTKEKPYVLR